MIADNLNIFKKYNYIAIQYEEEEYAIRVAGFIKGKRPAKRVKSNKTI